MRELISYIISELGKYFFEKFRRKFMSKVRERVIQKQIKDYLKSKGYYVIRATGEVGTPDLVACISDGQFLAVEIKRSEKEKPSKMQRRTLNNIHKLGGIALVAYSLEQFKKDLDSRINGYVI